MKAQYVTRQADLLYLITEGQVMLKQSILTKNTTMSISSGMMRLNFKTIAL